jgi:hypothetical protein
MKIQLDHIQRLNLHALLGAQRGDLATIRSLWALQDRLALTSDEESALESKRELLAGQERVAWEPTRSIPQRDFDFTETELARMRAAVENWTGYGAGSDRRWLEPLLALLGVLPSPSSINV